MSNVLTEEEHGFIKMERMYYWEAEFKPLRIDN